MRQPPATLTVWRSSRRPVRHTVQAQQLNVDRRGLFPRHDIGRNHERVLGSCIPGFAENCRFAEAGRFELLQEGHALLGARNSREPIRLASLSFRRQRCAQNDLSGKYGPARSDHSTQFPENSRSGWVQVEDAIHDCRVDTARPQRKMLHDISTLR
jgi:hypothetical protein